MECNVSPINPLLQCLQKTKNKLIARAATKFLPIVKSDIWSEWVGFTFKWNIWGILREAKQLSMRPEKFIMVRLHIPIYGSITLSVRKMVYNVH